MKIIDKIVTSVTQPQQTNVLWHNPETGELKMFGNKGWEVVGGSAGSSNNGDAGNSNDDSSSTNGYPVVTVEDNFDITVNPNTFYDIKNDDTSEININFVNDGYSTANVSKQIIFTYDEAIGSEDMIAMLVQMIGGKPVPDRTIEGYTYRMDTSMSGIAIPLYFSEMPTTGKSVNYYTSIFGEEFVGTMTNIQIFNETTNYIVYIEAQGQRISLAFTEVSNDNSNFVHKYNVLGVLSLLIGTEYVYTQKPYTQITDTSEIYIAEDMSLSSMIPSTIKVELNENQLASDTIKEFVFNFYSPASVTFNRQIKWNNDNYPDLTKSGVYTISIVNEVGCYTFVNS